MPRTRGFPGRKDRRRPFGPGFGLQAIPWWLGAVWVALQAWAAVEASAVPDRVVFSRDVAPILSRKCLTCHGPAKAKGGYRLDTFERLITPGESKAAPVIPGRATESALARLLGSADPDERMPRNDEPLSSSDQATIRQWIDEGAEFDGLDRSQPLALMIPAGPRPDPPAAYPFPVPIRALGIMPDGESIVVGGFHEVTFWNPTTGEMGGRVGNLPQRILGLAVSPDGTRVAVVGGEPGRLGEAIVIDRHRGDRVRLLGRYPEVALAVCFSPDGSRVAVGGADAAIRIHEVENGREIRVIQQHADWIHGLSFSPDGTRLVAASRDRSARVFRLETGELETTFPDHATPVNAAVFSNDRTQVISAGRDRRILLWSAADGKRAGEFGAGESEVQALLVADGELFAGGLDGKVRQFRLSDRQRVRELNGHRDRVLVLAWHCGRRWVVSASHDAEVRIWNLDSGALLSAFRAVPGAPAP